MNGPEDTVPYNKDAHGVHASIEMSVVSHSTNLKPRDSSLMEGNLNIDPLQYLAIIDSLTQIQDASKEKNCMSGLNALIK